MKTNNLGNFSSNASQSKNKTKQNAPKRGLRLDVDNTKK